MEPIHEKRLLDVARACRETKHPESFEMTWYAHIAETPLCSTPACALGNYAANPELQSDFVLDLTDGSIRFRNDGEQVCWREWMSYFGLTRAEMDELFEQFGCGEAKTHIEAAEYIERFVASKKSTSETSA